MAGTIDKLKSFFLSKTVLVRFILVNIAVFLAVHVIALAASITGSTFSVAGILELPSEFSAAIMRPWTLLTYMFTHYDLLHILFNMLWLYCFGIVFLDNFSDRDFVAAYIIGGLSGALFYIAANSLMPAAMSGGLLGSSAAVLSVAAATVVRAPNYRINLFLIGMVKIKWIAVACIAISLLTTNAGSIGSHSAHVGGIVAGILFALNARYGFVCKRPKKKKAVILPPLHRYTPDEMSQSEIDRAIDRLLVKVKQSGYNSLSDKEKKELSDLSKKIKI